MTRKPCAFAAGAIAFSGMLGWGVAAMAAGNILPVSQRDRSFKPKTLDIVVGDVIRVVNDDGELVHHAYIDSAAFKFDSGEQAPGTQVDIKIPAPGTYNILCIIHPKMRLVVNVK